MPDIDLFASRLSNKVSTYCSFQPDPDAYAIDAFTIEWNFSLAYAFPPFCLLGKILQKIIRDKANVILIAPKWPTKAWYPIFMQLMLQQPIYIQVKETTLFLSHRDAVPRHPMTGKLTLMAAKLSGNLWNPGDIMTI